MQAHDPVARSGCPHETSEALVGVVRRGGGDGHMDLVQGLVDGSVRVYLNDGTGGFGALPPDPGSGDATSYVRDVLAHDFTGDGLVDLFLITAVGSPNKLLVGSGGFDDERQARIPAADLVVYGVAAGDLDGDGAPDLFFSGDQDPSRLFINDGSGMFREAAPASLPDLAEPRGRKPVLGDLDGDGSLDIYLPSVARDRVWLNDGAGRFLDYTDLLLGVDTEYGYTAALADVDRDGCLDVAVAKYDGRVRLYRNDCYGRLFDYTACPTR
jgi:hypothetical protein